MNLTRRHFARTVGAASALAATGGLRAARQTNMGVGSASYHLRSRYDRRDNKPPLTETLTFLDYGYELGAGGVQCGVSEVSNSYARKIRAKCEEYGMYFEASGRLPNDDTEIDQFKDFCKAVRNSGAKVIRTVLFPGRRYENHVSMETYEQAEKQAWHKLTLAEPTLRKMGLKAAIENHKNLRIPDMLSLMKRLQSEYVGVTVDFGNNYTLMENPIQIAEAFAPYAYSSHIKDHQLQEYEDGFRLLDVPLGEGIIDLKQVINILRGAQPSIKFTLETMTRDALDVPWLTDKYWATFDHDDLSGRDLAHTLMTVKATQPKEPFERISKLSKEEQIRLEDDNVRKGIAYARDVLGL